VCVFSLLTPDRPQFTNSYSFAGAGRDIFAREQDVFLCAQSSFQILHLNLTGIDDENPIPATFSLSAAYPNPFNAQTIIGYSLARAEVVSLTIFDILGRKIATLMDSPQQVGEYAVKWDASFFPSGVYFARLEAGDKSETVKLLLLK
jgi:hypothetical protein